MSSEDSNVLNAWMLSCASTRASSRFLRIISCHQGHARPTHDRAIIFFSESYMYVSTPGSSLPFSMNGSRM